MSDIKALQDRITQLEARLGQVAPSAPPPLPPVGYEPAVRVTTPLATLVGGPELGYLHRDVREVRRLVMAVALCYGADAPRQHVPKIWLESLRRLAASRATGLSWRDALVEAGLEVPDDLTSRTRDLRDDLDRIWNELLPVVAMALATVSTVGQRRIRERLGKLLS